MFCRLFRRLLLMQAWSRDSHQLQQLSIRILVSRAGNYVSNYLWRSDQRGGSNKTDSLLIRRAVMKMNPSERNQQSLLRGESRYCKTWDRYEVADRKQPHGGCR